ncbi:phosphatidylserine/phosphatidylglycerophosphate/cardiolipin synthase family protein [Candidatus Riflebacteria bacterium]
MISRIFTKKPVIFIFIALLIGISGVTAKPPRAQYRPFNENETLDSAFAIINTKGADIKTKIRLLTKNDEAWYARWFLLHQAKKTIDMTYFIIENDIFGYSLLGLLQKKAKEGVKIRLMVDGRIHRLVHRLSKGDEYQELAGLPNVEIKLYNPISGQLLNALKDLRYVLASNHDKIIIVDGKLCLIGGRNIGKDYFVGKREYKIVYRDTDILMQGSHVSKQLKLAFDEEFESLKTKKVKKDLINFKPQKTLLDVARRVMERYLNGRGIWNFENEEFSKKMRKTLKRFTEELVGYKNLQSYASFSPWNGQRKYPVKILDKNSFTGSRSDIRENLVRFIDGCKEEIIIQNPYIVLSDWAYMALKKASARGVRIIMHTNSATSTDNMFPQAFLFEDWKEMLKDMPTLRLFVAKDQDSRLHAKHFVFDSQVTIVGTYNLDPLSFDINSEVVGVIKSKSFATMSRLRILSDIQKGNLEYKIKVLRDGSIEVLYGPESHTDKKILKKLNFLRKLQWLRPLI